MSAGVRIVLCSLLCSLAMVPGQDMSLSCRLSHFAIRESGQTASSIELEWDTTCSWSTVLEITWKADGSIEWESGMEIRGNETSFTVTSLSRGAMYHFRLVLAGDRGVVLTTQGETVSENKATNVAAIPDYERGALNISWKPAKSVADPPARQQVRVQRLGEGVQDWEVVEEGALLPSTVDRLQVTTLVPFTFFRVRVDTIFANVWGVMASLPTSAVQTPPASPEVVRGLRVVNTSESTLSISWQPLTGAQKGGNVDVQIEYIVEVVATSSGTDLTLLQDFAAQFPDRDPIRIKGAHVASFTMLGLPKFTTFEIRISAANSAGKVSPASSIVSGSTLATAPRELSAPDVSYAGGSIVLSWDALLDRQSAGGKMVSFYRIFQRRQDEAVFSAIHDEATASGAGNRARVAVNISGTAAGYAYYFKVAAVSGESQGPLSPPSQRAVSPIMPTMLAPTVEISYPTHGMSATASLSWPPADASFATQGYAVAMQDLSIGPDAPFDAGRHVMGLEHTILNLTLGKLFAFRLEALSDVNGFRSRVSDAVTVETRDLQAPTSVRLEVYGRGLKVDWTPPLQNQDTQSYQILRVDHTGTIDMFAAESHQTSLVIPSASVDVGATYRAAVQTRFFGGLGSRVSLWSDQVMLPTAVPEQMVPPTIEVVVGCVTCLRVRWSRVLTSPQDGGSPVLGYEIFMRAQGSSSEESFVVSEDKAELLLRDLNRGESYKFRMRARNINGYATSKGQQTSWQLLATTAPDPPTNLRLLAGSDGVTAITIEWDPAPSGNKLPVFMYRLFKLSIENDLDPGTDLAMDALMPDDLGQNRRYRITGLRGGVEYIFKLKAINSDMLLSEFSNGASFIAGQEIPLAMKTLRSAPTADPDLVSHYQIKLTWIIPTQVDETGGAPIEGFRLQYTIENSADFDPNLATWCTSDDGEAPCQTGKIGAAADGLLGRVSELIFAIVKGTIYHFRIAAINRVGQGPWSSQSSYGTTVTPRYITTPPQPPAPTVFPQTDTSIKIDWTEYDQNCVQCYETKTINGGRSLTHLELHIRINHGPWFVYGERVTNVPECNEAARGDCIFNELIVPEPGGMLRQRDLNFQQKSINVGTNTMNQEGFYQFRLRSSNDNMTTWSEWSPVGSGTVFLPIINNLQVSGFPHIFQGVPTPTSMVLRFFSPYGLSADLFSVDFRVFYGYEPGSVSWDQVAVALTSPGASDTSASFATVSELIPDTTYYYRVVGISEQSEQLNVTRSNVSFASRTAIATPSSNMHVSVFKSPVSVERLAGWMYVRWTTLPPDCESGVVMEDGSISGCPRGRKGNLQAYRMYVRLQTESYDAPNSRMYETTWDINQVVVTGLIKGKVYCFSVAAVNTLEQGARSQENCTEAVRTPPAAPPRAESPAASLSTLRISFQQPDDIGAYDGFIKDMLLHMTPARPAAITDGQAMESFSITWQRSLVVTGLRANSEYRFTVQARNNVLDMWSKHSITLYAKTTSNPPSSLVVAPNGAETSSIDLKWDLPAPEDGQGNNTIYGYRVRYRAMQPTLGIKSGSQLCAVGEGGGGCRVSGLSAGTRYGFSVGTCTDAALISSFGPTYDELIYSTLVKLPKISRPVLSDLREDSVVVSWVADDGGLPLRSTSLYTKLENEPLDDGLPVDLSKQDPSIGATQLIQVDGLGPALEYRFLVKASNSLGQSESLLSLPILTLPAAVQTPTVLRVSTRSVVVRWVLWTGRRPIKTYRLRVKTAPTAVVLAADTSSDAAYEVSQRLIREAPWRDAGLVSGSTDEYEVGGLEGSMQVQVQVAASNDAGWGGWSQPAIAETLPLAPSLAFIQVVRATEVELKWTPPAGARQQYQILPLLFDNGAYRVQAAVIKDGGETLDSHLVKPLLKGRKYKFRVAVLLDDGSQAGIGDYSADSNAITTLSTEPAEGPPVEPDLTPADPSNLAVTASSIRLRWNPFVQWQKSGGAVIQKFVLEAMQVNCPEPADQDQSGGGPTCLPGWALSLEVDSMWAMVQPSEGTEGNTPAPSAPVSWQSVAFTGLEANTRYQFRIRSQNDFGIGVPGPQSEELLTLPPAMPPPRMIASLDSIVLTWSPGDYDAFEIRIANRNPLLDVYEAWRSVYAGKGESSLLLGDLLLDTEYKATMAARNSGGWGAHGPEQKGRTTLLAPALLRPPFELSQLKPTRATLNWIERPFSELPSSLGYTVYACTVDDADGVELLPAARPCSVPPEQLSECGGEEFPEALAHVCDNKATSYTRTGLRKNTRYTLRLANVNPGGAGPLGPQSSIFKTATSHPDKMVAPSGETVSMSIITARWEPVTEWNARGGLDMIAYFISYRAAGGGYTTPLAIYPMDPSSPAEAQYTFTGLQPNTVYYFRVFGENTACTLLEQVSLPVCCNLHQCSEPSDDSMPVATLLPAMPAPFLSAATEAMMLVAWPRIDGTPGNLVTMLVEYQDADRPSKDASDVWLRTHVDGAKTSVWIEGLRANNRYLVRLRGTDANGRQSPYGSSELLVTRPLALAPPRIVAVEATSVSLEWDPPRGRAANIIGYNISINLHLAPTPLFPQARTVTTFAVVQGDGRLLSYRPSGLTRDSFYSFSISPTNAAGDAKRSNDTGHVRTLLQDALASCSLYPAIDPAAPPPRAMSVEGNLFLFRASSGIRIQGDIAGLVPGEYQVSLRPYGLSREAAGDITLPSLDASLSLAELYANQAQNTSYRVTRTYARQAPPAESLSSPESSRLGASLLILLPAASAPAAYLVARCELGLARPPTAAQINSAVPMQAERGFCVLRPTAGAHYPQLSGKIFFDAGETDSQVLVRATICGVPTGSSLPLRLHEFGDLRSLPYSLGAPLVDMGEIVIDNLGSGFYDETGLAGLSLNPLAASGSCIGRAVAVYSPSPAEPDTIVATCVIGTRDPLDLITDTAPCTPCTHSLQQQQSIYDVASYYRVSWLSVWSLNLKMLSPDVGALPGLSIYYAHPMQLGYGQSPRSVARRFGLTDDDLAVLNPYTLASFPDTCEATSDDDVLSASPASSSGPGWKQTYQSQHKDALSVYRRIGGSFTTEWARNYALNLLETVC